MKKKNTAQEVKEEQVSQNATAERELKITLSTEAYSNLTRRALTQGCTVEELVAREIAQLIASGR